MDGVRFDRERILPAVPTRLPELARAHGQGNGRAPAARLELSLELTSMRAAKSTAGVASADELRERLSAWIKDVFEKHGLAFEELSPGEARKQVEAGGEWSPEAVAQRIVDFVKARDDGDPARRQLLRDAVARGFAEAESAFGGKLPEISYRTLELVERGLDELFGAPAPDAPAQPDAPVQPAGRFDASA